MVFNNEDKILIKSLYLKRLVLLTQDYIINCLNVFFSVGIARSAAPWPLVNCACVPQVFNSFLTSCFVQLFSENSSVNLFAVYPFKYKLYQNLVLVAEYCSDVCCDECPVPQIDRKLISKRTLTW